MPSRHRLASVAHSTVHHAVSGLCYVCSHLRKACIEIGVYSCTLDLLKQNPCPEKFRNIQPINLSIGALRDKFIEILNSEGFQIEELSEAILTYEFPPFMDDYCSNCSIRITSIFGNSVTRAVDFLGRSAQVKTPDTEPGAASNP